MATNHCELTFAQRAAILGADASLRVYLMENTDRHTYGPVVLEDVRNDLRALRDAFPEIAWLDVP